MNGDLKKKKLKVLLCVFLIVQLILEILLYFDNNKQFNK